MWQHQEPTAACRPPPTAPPFSAFPSASTRRSSSRSRTPAASSAVAVAITLEGGAARMDQVSAVLTRT